jgi:acyl dehydratase
VSQTLRFAAPVYVRDEVVAQVQAVHIRAMAAANGSMTSRNVYVSMAACHAAMAAERMTAQPSSPGIHAIQPS